MNISKEVTDDSVRPEDDDEEAKRRMIDEMRGLICATDESALIDPDDTASEEDFDISDKRLSEPSSTERTSDVSSTDRQSNVTCKVCTTCHSPPVPICCESCGNVLQPVKLSADKSWICSAPGCQGKSLGYVNSADAGICGICGARRGS